MGGGRVLFFASRSQSAGKFKVVTKDTVIEALVPTTISLLCWLLIAVTAGRMHSIGESMHTAGFGMIFCLLIYGKRIGNHTQAFEWYQFEFQGHDIIQCQMTKKRYQIELYLQWQTDRKSYLWCIERQHFQWSWTTPNPVFWVTLYFDVEYLINS